MTGPVPQRQERLNASQCPGPRIRISSVSSFSTTVKDVSAGSAVQWIGWDPLAQRIRSWIFDESGAFGEGTWTRDGNRWTIKTATVLQNGKKATATFVLVPLDADTIALQSTGRSVDGQPIPDTKVVKLRRVK